MENTQAEQFIPASCADAPNLATSLPTSQNGNKDWSEILGEAKKERDAWQPEQERSNQKLYVILAKCLAAYGRLDKHKSEKEAFLKAYKSLEMPGNSRTRLAAKVIVYVFAVDRKKRSSYASVIAAAYDAGISEHELPTWIIDCGGIEEIRRKGGEPDPDKLSAQAAIDLAKEELPKCDELFEINGDNSPLRVFPNDNFCVAVIRFASNKKCTIVHATSNPRARDAVLVAMGHELQDKKAAKTSMQLKRGQIAKRTKAIEAAVNS